MAGIRSSGRHIRADGNTRSDLLITSRSRESIVSQRAEGIS